jgi:hypothetical protein
VAIEGVGVAVTEEADDVPEIDLSQPTSKEGGAKIAKFILGAAA